MAGYPGAEAGESGAAPPPRKHVAPPAPHGRPPHPGSPGTPPTHRWCIVPPRQAELHILAQAAMLGSPVVSM